MKYVATTGFFDGVHNGHLAVFKGLKDASKRLGLPSCVISFWPHPRVVINKIEGFLLLNSLAEKEELIKQAGIDRFVVLPFNEELSRQTAEEFLTNVLIKDLNVGHLVLGYDHSFGYGRPTYGEIEEICQKHKIGIEIVLENKVGNTTVSSSGIKKALLEGKLDKANEMLGYNYMITGEIAHGHKLGRTIGFPTANISTVIGDSKLIPCDGVYAAKINLEQKEYNGMVYIGRRPTVNTIPEKSIEVNIFNFNEDIYSKKIVLQLCKYVREDTKFYSIENLKLQLQKDKINVEAYFKME